MHRDHIHQSRILCGETHFQMLLVLVGYEILLFQSAQHLKKFNIATHLWSTHFEEKIIIK
jgi:hypothetical protein